MIKNSIQLITYPDSLGKNLSELHFVLKRYLTQAINGVHILPFYPSSADRGFSPLTYYEVDPKFGTWEDIHKIGEDFELMIDFMVNHISRQSIYFQDYVEKGMQSEYADMFLSFNKISPDHEISAADLKKVYTRKPRMPVTHIERADGSKEKVWCTFDFEQIDVDIESSKTREVFREFLIFLARQKPRFIRMDAFAYTTFQLGTNCFFVEPNVWEILEWLKEYIAPFGAELLPEVHENYHYQRKLSGQGYWVYDFALPFLVLHALYTGSNKNLVDWLPDCPEKQITTLDTHDGMGVVDVNGLLTEKEIEQTINILYYQKGVNAKNVYSSSDYQNLDVYQINCTYFSALSNDDAPYIVARVIQFYAYGIPQVYYVGLLAGQNDIMLVEKTRHGRDINRHGYTLDEIAAEFKRPVVQRLIHLMEFRNTYPAFDGKLIIANSPEDQLIITRTLGDYQTTAYIHLKKYTVKIEYYDTEMKSFKSFIP